MVLNLPQPGAKILAMFKNRSMNQSLGGFLIFREVPCVHLKARELCTVWFRELPCLVFTCRWGLERVEGEAVENFEAMSKIQMEDKKCKKNI